MVTINLDIASCLECLVVNETHSVHETVEFMDRQMDK